MKKFQGIGLLELLLSLSVIAVILTLVTGYFVVTKRNSDLTRAMDQIVRLETAIGNWKGKQTNYAGLSTKALYSTGSFVAGEYDVANDKLYSPFSSPITITSAGTNEEYYTIALSNIPAWACTSLQQKLDQEPDAFPHVGCFLITNTSRGNLLFLNN